MDRELIKRLNLLRGSPSFVNQEFGDGGELLRVAEQALDNEMLKALKRAR